MDTKSDTSSQCVEQADGAENPSARLRRADPARGEPIRHWAALHHQAEAQADGQAKAHPSAASLGEEGETVGYGVRLGYQVIEEHLRQGQAAARRVNGQKYERDPFSPDLQELVRRVLRSTADVGAVWFDLIDAGLRMPDVLRARLRAWTAEGESAAAESHVPSGPLWVDLMESVERGVEQLKQQLSPQIPESSAPPFGAAPSWPPLNPGAFGPVRPNPIPQPKDSAQAETSVSIEILACCPTQVTLQLHPYTGGQALMTPGLQALDPNKPSLTDVTFTPDGENGQATVRIRVPHGQPPDVYTGVVLDQTTGRPQGALSVRVNEQENEQEAGRK